MKRFSFWIITLALLTAGCAASQGPEGPSPEPAEEPAAAAGQGADAEDGGPQAAGDDGGAAPRQAAGGGDAGQAGQQAQPDQPELPPEILAGARVDDIRVNPSPIEITVGDTVALDSFEYTPVDEEGDPVPDVPVLFGMVPSEQATVTQDRQLVGLGEGDYQLVVAVYAPPPGGGAQPQPKIFRTPVVVHGRPIVEVRVDEPEHTVYTGTSVPLRAHPITDFGNERTSAEVEWVSRNPEVARVTSTGYVRGVSPGNATIVALSEGVEGTMRIQVLENPVRSLELRPVDPTARTGDVLRLEAVARDAGGDVVDDIALTYSVASDATVEGREGSVSSGGPGAFVYEDGSFVAARPGVYRVVGSAGTVSAETLITTERREVEQEIAELGQGLVSHHPSSDLWVFQGADGRDYAYVGTHSGGQTMFAWDVTDPSDPVLTDSVVVDARVVNDVKVNDEATIAIITREGASNRQNGIVLLDISDPAHPVILSEYTETLSGGVHNTYIVDDLVYAIHDGTLDVHIIDISDPARPTEVGRWGIDEPGKYLHDIWVLDGLAYVSYWDDGVYVLDVGDGRWGGTPTEPVAVSSYSYTDLPGQWGNTHVAFPYTNSDGHTYLFVGDEVFGCEECVSRANREGDGPRGYVHIFDMEDPENLREVARYEVPEAGVHNLWAEDDKLYAAYYEAGLRVVDISGELRGNLYDQGRQIAWFPTASEDGFVPNQAMAWGPQPYGDAIFVSDMNSGLWVLELQPDEGDLLP
ncbi:MAG: Ig-like domain-containing protein [Longimicrobiales bacterium]|nr:Ig-like domain-containing protein [Longimicrobiales bacterium]